MQEGVGVHGPLVQGGELGMVFDWSKVILESKKLDAVLIGFSLRSEIINHPATNF